MNDAGYTTELVAEKQFITPRGDFATMRLYEERTSTGVRFTSWFDFPGLLGETATPFDTSKSLLDLYDDTMSWTERMGWVVAP